MLLEIRVQCNTRKGPGTGSFNEFTNRFVLFDSTQLLDSTLFERIDFFDSTRLHRKKKTPSEIWDAFGVSFLRGGTPKCHLSHCAPDSAGWQVALSMSKLWARYLPSFFFSF